MYLEPVKIELFFMGDRLKKIFTGTELSVLILKGVLEKEGFSSIVKNNFRSGLMAGFGAQKDAVELYIYEEDYEKVADLIAEFKQNNS